MARSKKTDVTFDRLRGTVIGKRESKYFAVLIAYGNPDLGQDPREPICGGLTVYADTIEEISDVERKWVKGNFLGAGNFARAQVYEKNEEGTAIVGVAGYINYNGTFTEVD